MEKVKNYQDLLYFGYDYPDEREENRKCQADFIREIKERFLEVELKNAYDYIKGFRQEVYLDEIDSDNYYAWLIAFGWFDFSFSLQILMMSYDKPEQKEKFNKYFELAKSQYPEKFKQKIN